MLRLEAETRVLFEEFLDALRSGTVSEDELQDIQSLVGRIYSSDNRATHVRTSNFIEEVIAELGAAERPAGFAENGPIFREFYAMYIKTIFIDAKAYGIS